ncbi:hypothetical protein K402DRAFT_323942 [Aulographum hederae CBS 113979]|uniref:Uncharacterized protein n=1 Tax=Aulographum hederae CBS 113979 TaxID=1176131 RepID=A0A6G1HC99_9PEZI|nr:hypothetical protein K402DRAFT_323942 [Aulographum hederae CBS 113979]
MEDEEIESVEEPSILEYARFHGLTADYFSEKIPWSKREQPVERHLLDQNENLKWDLRDESFLHEPLTVSRKTMILLQDTIKDEPDLPVWDANIMEATPRRRAADLKMELPLLRTDDELDLRHFGSVAEPDLTNHGLPEEHVDDENDEGLAWPSWFHGLPARYDLEMETEKLEVSRDGMLFLQKVLRDDYFQEDEDALIASELTSKKKPAVETITPPLMPLTPPLTSFIPSSPTMQLPLLSDSTDSLALEIDILNKSIEQQDAIRWEHQDGSSDCMLMDDEAAVVQAYDLGSEQEPPSSPPRKRRRDEMKVDVPLLPAEEPGYKRIKTVSFSELARLHEFAPDQPFIPYISKTSERINSDDDLDKFFEEVIEPIAADVNRRVEQEQLQEADSTKRVSIPVMDFSLPPAPWNEYRQTLKGKHREGETGLQAQTKLLQRVAKEEFVHAPKVQSTKRLERNLPWDAFPPGLAKVAPDDPIHGTEELAALLQDISIQDIVTSDMLIWKPEGLRILDEDESEDELSLCEFGEDEEVEDDIDSQIRKRKFELEQQPERPSNPVEPASSVAAQDSVGMGKQPAAKPKETPRNRKGEMLPPPVPKRPKQDNSLMFGGSFSATTALSKFMESQGIEVTKSKTPEPGPRTNTARMSPAIRNIPEAVAEAFTSAAIPVAPLPIPSLQSSPPACSFVISSALLATNRPLARAIERLYPLADLIERDFSSRFCSYTINGKPTNTASADLEADLIISPTIGLIITTLQRIKQRALPGQPARPGVKDRLLNVSKRYEKIILVVSEGRIPSTDAAIDRPFHKLDIRDCQELASLQGFAAALEAGVQVTYCAGGIEELAQWTVNLMTSIGLSRSCGNGTLLHDETFWELFLRRAGCNAFAAQAILAELKEPRVGNKDGELDESQPAAVYGQYGLPAFVLMSAEERMRRFQMVVGRRVVKSMNTVLEQQWASASNQFAAVGRRR